MNGTMWTHWEILADLVASLTILSFSKYDCGVITVNADLKWKVMELEKVE